MGNLIPGEAIIYERDGGIVYARYRDWPHSLKERWVVGGRHPIEDPLSAMEWENIKTVAEQNPAVRSQLDKLLTVYYTVKSQYIEDKK